MADPPLLAGAAKLTVALPLPAMALAVVGASGTPKGVTMEGADAAPVPAPLVAVTVQLYAVPLVNPDTVIGLLAPVAVWPPPQSTV